MTPQSVFQKKIKTIVFAIYDSSSELAFKGDVHILQYIFEDPPHLIFYERTPLSCITYYMGSPKLPLWLYAVSYWLKFCTSAIFFLLTRVFKGSINLCLKMPNIYTLDAPGDEMTPILNILWTHSEYTQKICPRFDKISKTWINHWVTLQHGSKRC